jgi:hypothetical protein
MLQATARSQGCRHQGLAGGTISLLFPFSPVFFADFHNRFVSDSLAGIQGNGDPLKIQYQPPHRCFNHGRHRFRVG